MEIIKIRVEMKKKKKKKPIIEKTNESKSWFFKKINKIVKPLTRLIKKKRDFSSGPVAKILCSPHREFGFNPWSGNLVLDAATKDPICHN